MILDLENKIIQLCAQGMDLEGENPQEASRLFYQAWNEAESELDKSIAAHYVARQQSSVQDKLKWDTEALLFALKSDHPTAKAFYPSLYLNVGKCYEDLNEIENALQNYQLGLQFADALDEDGYGRMIRAGIESGIERMRSMA